MPEEKFLIIRFELGFWGLSFLLWPTAAIMIWFREFSLFEKSIAAVIAAFGCFGYAILICSLLFPVQYLLMIATLAVYLICFAVYLRLDPPLTLS